MKKLWQQRWLWLIIIFAFYLRLPLLTGSFWLDEAAQALESVRPFSQQLDIVPDFQPPLLHYVVHFAAQLSTTEWWLRLWGALIPGLITIWLTYELGKKLFNEQVGVVSSLLLTTSSFHIFYSQELRPYSLPAMWGALSSWLLFQKKFTWWQFALVSLAGLYSSYLYPFLLIPQLWLLWQKHGRAVTTKITAVTVALFAPWLPMFFQQLNAGQQVRVDLPGWETVVSLPQAKVLFLVPMKFIFGILNIELNWVYLLLTMAVLVSLVLAWHKYPTKWQRFWQKFFKPKKNGRWQLLLLFIAPLVLSWLISFVVPVVRPKRLLYLMPFFYLLASLPLASKQVPKKIAWLPVVLLLGINLYGTTQYWNSPQLQRENWRDLKQEMVETLPQQETLAIMVFDEPFAPWRWYQPESVPTLVVSSSELNEANELNALLRVVNDYRYVLVFDYLRDLSDPNNLLEPAIESFGFQGIGVFDYPNIGFVRIYSRPGNALGYSL